MPLRARRDGWTPARQYSFILALARGLKPGAAAALVGMSRQKAYRLRERPYAAGFDAAWRFAYGFARRRRSEELRRSLSYERAVNGVLEPVRYRGRIVGWQRRYDNRALLRLLDHVEREARRRGEEPFNFLG